MLTAKKSRSSGILLHITSLPSKFGIGDLGPESYRFIHLLVHLNQRYWSILPLSPTRLEDGNSPYQTSSAFAGTPLLISPEKLIEEALLPSEYERKVVRPSGRVNFRAVYSKKEALLKKAHVNFKKTKNQSDFEAFHAQNELWLDNYALYAALRKKTSNPWYLWNSSLRKRETKAVAEKNQALKEEIEREKFLQYTFFSQWQLLKDYCKKKHVSIIGDLPFYMAYDSADVWVHPELFSLNAYGKPRFVGGVPPDYFSATGQLWGNPVYDWQKMQQTGFEWWTNRIKHSLKFCDKLRLDHFRGFVAYWQVPAFAETAKKGRWVKTPSEEFFESLKKSFPSLPFIAEDLGMIDTPVKRAIRRLGVPGMRVLLFGFDGSAKNPHLPKNHIKNSVVYTGTHDTNTVRGWFAKEATAKEKQNVYKQIGRRVSHAEVSFEFVKLALESRANLSIIPLQDILSFGAEARMNNPSRNSDNWRWRVTDKQLASERLQDFGLLTAEYKRAS